MKIFVVVWYCALTQVFSEDTKLSRVDDLRVKFLLLQKRLWNIVDDYVNNLINEIKPELYLINEIKNFDDQLQKEFSNDLGHELKAIENVEVWKKTNVELRHIYGHYERFRRFQKLKTTSSSSLKEEWINMAQLILQDGKFSIEQAQKSITEYILYKNLYNEVLKNTEGENFCKIDQSPHQILYNLYNTIEVAQLKGYIMMQFSYMILKLYKKENFSIEAMIINDRYKERTKKSAEYVKKVMKKSSRQLWKCDPKKHILNETYIEVTQLLQGYIQNEVDLSPKKDTCAEDCSHYAYAKSYRCYENLYCSKQRNCNGKILYCRYVHSSMLVCPASRIGRRYEYIEYGNGSVLGIKQKCDTVKVDSWTRGFVECSYCFCLCDEQGVYSDRFINMRSVIADIKNNRVVTGLRFVKKNRIIHMQIQEGKLLPQGKIDQSTIRWVQPEDYKITDRSIHNNQDYYTLTWKQCSIDLDDLTAEDGYILTGVRFHRIGTHLNLEIHMSLFNFTSGNLSQNIDHRKWNHNRNTDIATENPRTRVPLISPGIPTLWHSSMPDSTSDQYIVMNHTDFDKDAAQTTVPFFDAQPVESSVPVPLSGAGIYHKGVPGSGGFIALKIITYDFGRHLNAKFPKEEVDIN